MSMGMAQTVAMTETTRNTAGQVVNTTYTDISGNTVKEVAGNNITYYTYDKSGYGYLTYLTDTEGTKSILTLSLCDADGNNFAQISQPEVSDGSYIIGENSIVSYTGYDEKGNVTSETDGKGSITTYSYDEEGRLASCNIDDTEDADDITVKIDGKTEDFDKEKAEDCYNKLSKKYDSVYFCKPANRGIIEL